MQATEDSNIHCTNGMEKKIAQQKVKVRSETWQEKIKL